jgi:hypothetical protein
MRRLDTWALVWTRVTDQWAIDIRFETLVKRSGG